MTYGKLHVGSSSMDGATTWRVTGLPAHVSIRFKSLFPRVPKHQTGSFILNDSPATCSDLLWFMQRYPLDMAETVRERLERGHARAVATSAEASSILGEEWTPAGPPARFKPGMAPYPYQAQAAALAARLGRLLLMDDVGLGKTVSTLAALVEAGKYPAAIIVQSHLAEQWVEEYVEEFTDLRWHIIKGRKPYKLPPADLYIFKYSNISGWTDYAAAGRFSVVAFDEIQELRHGGETQKGASARIFADAASIRLGLTATPIYNYGSEIFHVVDLIEPGALGGWNEFIIEWCVSKGGHWVVKDPAALGAYLRDINLVLRRTEVDVGKQMPPVNVLMQHVAFDEAAVDAVAEEAKVLALKVLNGSFHERGLAARELDMMARHATGMAKAQGVAAMVRMLAESGEKVLLAGWHRDVYDVWLKALGDLAPVMYTGSETPKQKQASKAAFISGDARIMIISLRSGAGLDGLQRVCRTLVFGELDWSPQVHKQVIGRLRRPGQQGQVDAIYAHTNGGSDPVVVEMLGLKASQSAGIVDPFASASQEVSADDSRIKRLAEMYLARAA